MIEEKRNLENIHISLLDICNDSFGNVAPFDYNTNRLLTLGEGSLVVEFTGMMNGGKSKQTRLLCDYLVNNKTITEHYGRPIQIGVFKTNEMVKKLFEKNPEKRALFNKAIIHSHGGLLSQLYLDPYLHEGVSVVELDLALLDRGPHDDVIWTGALRDYGLISPETADRQIGIAEDSTSLVDLVVGVNVPPEEAMRREGEEGNVMMMPFLRIIYPHYQLLSDESNLYGQPHEIGAPYLGINGLNEMDMNAERIRETVSGLLLSGRKEKAYGDLVLE